MVLLALLALLALLGACALLASATITGDQPPASGDWVVSHPTDVSGEAIALDGDLIVSARLTVGSSTVTLSPSQDGSSEVNVTPSGHLDLDSTRISSATQYGYGFVVNGELNASLSTIEECYTGVVVRTALHVELRDTSIIQPTQHALTLDGSNDTVVQNLTVRSDWMSQSTSATGVAADPSAPSRVPVEAPAVIRVIRCSARIDGMDISFKRNISVNLVLERRAAGAEFEIPCEAPVIEVGDGASLNASNITLTNSIAVFFMHYDISNYVSGGDLVVHVPVSTAFVRARDPADLEVRGLTELHVSTAIYPNSAVTKSGLPFRTVVERVLVTDPLVVGSSMEATTSTPGPHGTRVVVADTWLSKGRVIDLHLHPGYDGASPPTYACDVLLENVTVLEGRMPVNISFDPQFMLMKTLRASVRVVGCNFTDCMDSLMTLSYLPGPDPGTGGQWFALNDTLLIESTVIDHASPASFDPRHPNAGALPILILTTRTDDGRNLYERDIEVRNCTLHQIFGQLFQLEGHPASTPGRESLAITGCTWDHNAGLPIGYWMTIEGWEVVTVSNSTFRDNAFDRGILITDPGGDALAEKSAQISILGDSFINNSFYMTESGSLGSPHEVIHAAWGGDLVVSRNDIDGPWMTFLNVTELPQYTRYSRLQFDNNSVHECVRATVLLYGADANHTMLSVACRDNLAWNSTAPLLDYPKDRMEVVQEDNDARIQFINNTAWNCSGAVLSCYGDVEVRGNRFTDCNGFVVRIEHLHLHAPVIAGNVFVRCHDAYYIGSKYWLTLHTDLAISGEDVNCTGTAFWFYKMAVEMDSIVLASNTTSAIVADESEVDIFNSSLDPASAEVVMRGYVRVWFHLETWVQWANAAGVASGHPVPQPMVSFFDSGGNWTSAMRAGADGHLAPMRLMQWSLEMFAGPQTLRQLSPYNVTATCSSLAGSATVVLDRERVGPDAALVLIADGYLPVVVISYPFNGTITNLTLVNLRGYASDIGSGVLGVTLSWTGEEQVDVTLTPAGDYDVWLALPEGVLTVTARVRDVALNSADFAINVTVDRTPPLLVVSEPMDGIVTAQRTLRVVGHYEPGCRVFIDIVELPGASGTLDVPIHLMEGLNVFVVRAMDAAGNNATVTLHLTLDTIPPTLKVDRPKDGSKTNRSVLAVEGRTEGASGIIITVSAVDKASVDTMAEPLADGTFSLQVHLYEGLNTLAVRAYDLAGNAVAVTLKVTLDSTPPDIVIISPADGSLTNSPRINVVADVAPDAVQVYIGGTRIYGTGRVEQEVALREGGNSIAVRAIDAMGNERVIVVNVILDVTPPFLVVTSPATDPYLTNNASVRVAGRVEGGSGNVTVAGRVVPIVQGAFEVTLELTEDGVQSIQVTARDAAGNVASRSLTVDLDRVPPPLVVTYDPAGPRVRGSVGTLTVTWTTDATAIRLEFDVSSGGRSWVKTLTLGPTSNNSFPIDLSVGDNIVTVRALDRYGNWATATPHAVNFERTGGGGWFPSVRPATWLAVAVIAAVCILAVGVYVVRGRRAR